MISPSSTPFGLLSYARPRELERRELDPGDLLRAAASLYRDKAEVAGIAIEVEVQPALPAVRGDREALEACLANLVTNAIDACVWDPDTEKQHSIKLDATANSGGPVCLQVRDNGMGISEENQRKILSSMFTTKGIRDFLHHQQAQAGPLGPLGGEEILEDLVASDPGGSPRRPPTSPRKDSRSMGFSTIACGAGRASIWRNSSSCRASPVSTTMGIALVSARLRSCW